MTGRIFLALGVFLLATPMVARAQASTTAPNAARREMAAERREAMRLRRDARKAMTPEQRAAARAQREARFNAMPADQQEYIRNLRAYQQALRATSRDLNAQVTAGTITRDQMARQLKSYRDANRPKRPAGMPEPARRP